MSGNQTTRQVRVNSSCSSPEYFASGFRDLLRNVKIGLVVPQQSLRESVRKVFRRTPGSRADMVMTPFDVGLADGTFDLLVVDEAHRLNQRANQSSGVQNQKFRLITEKLFGSDDLTKTQIDWITAKSRHQIFLLDAAQSVRPADVPRELLEALVSTAKAEHRYYPLISQMRVRAGADYVRYIRRLLGAEVDLSSSDTVEPEVFEGYDFRLFASLSAMERAIRL